MLTDGLKLKIPNFHSQVTVPFKINIKRKYKKEKNNNKMNTIRK